MVETGGKATLLVRGGGLYLGFINGVEFDIILDPIYRNQEGAERGHWRSRGPSRLGGGAPLHNVYVLIDAMQQEVFVDVRVRCRRAWCNASFRHTLTVLHN